MHILIIPSWYPTSYNELSGVFFKVQAEALAKNVETIGVIAVTDVGVRNIIKSRKVDLFYKYFVENDVHSFIYQYPDFIAAGSVKKKLKKFFFIRTLYKYIEQRGIPDLIHLHSYPSGDFAIYLKEKFNIPFVVTEHQTGFARKVLSRKELNFARVVFERSDYNIAVSKQFKNLLQQQFSIKFDYVPNIVNTNFFYSIAQTQSQEFNFINIAFLDKKKNQDMLIRAFKKAFKDRPHVRLTIVGDGGEYNNLNALIKQTGMRKQISLYGMASRQEVKDLLQNSHAFVLSSKHETFGVVVIEAMACGLPVLATKCGGPESIISSKELGLLCEVSETSLANALGYMYSNINDFDPEIIRKHVEDHFSEKAVSNKLIKIYEKIKNEDHDESCKGPS